MNDTRIKKDKNQHIQVFVRVRPINITEKYGKSVTVVEVPSNKEVIVRERPHDKLSKKFTFDRVFGASSKQIDVYNEVVSPLLEEVLAGYNCTVFAYGQTGTGKTFTMEGQGNDPTLHWQSDTSAGIIPRALSHLFDELRLLEAQEYTVRVSFLELYNEELFDLLSPTDDASKIRLYEDASKKGAVIIHGLEEVTVHNKSEVYKILEKGSEKRQTAATLMNAHSSRSHTVFSITVHIKENTVEGEELLKTGKLNLVDLAGSENVGRSGAIDRRAREAGNINQSLLTLGRVITALVERAPHIPYRESKLTRLLQESLGGRTKTSIIATISPASINVEETLSTLDYAHRAKNITNRPEINQKLSKKALLKEYTEEIERLRRDLLATRERNGVYLAQDNYNDMQALIECQGREIEEKINHIKALEETMQNKEKIFSDLNNELHDTKSKLVATTHILKSTESHLEMTEQDRDEQKHLVEKHVSAEKALLSQAQTLLNVANTATAHTYKLHEKIIRKSKVEEENENLVQQFRDHIAHQVTAIENDLSRYTQELVQFCLSLKNQTDGHAEGQTQNIDNIIHHISNNLFSQELTSFTKLSENINDIYSDYEKWLQNSIKNVSCLSEDESKLLNNVLLKLVPTIQNLIKSEVTKNFRLLNDQVSQKLEQFEQMSVYLKDSVNIINNQLLMDRDHLCKNIDVIKENIEVYLHNHDEIVQKRIKFKKMIDNVRSQYNELCADEEAYLAELHGTVSYVSNICQTVTEQASTNCNRNVMKQNDICSHIEEGIQTNIHDLTNSMKQNWSATEEAIKNSEGLLNNIETDVSSARDILINYKDLVECNVKNLQERTEQDKENLLTIAHGVHEVVSESTENHAKFMEELKLSATSVYTDTSDKLTNQTLKSNDWNTRISMQLRTTQHQVDKFLVEELRRDVPTGSTPARRDFQYPRQLVVTSPHDRIIQRFREAKRFVEECKDNNDELTLMNSLEPAANSTVVTDSNSPTSNFQDNTICNNIMDYDDLLNKEFDNRVNVITKSASTSDLSVILRSSTDSSINSEPDIYRKMNNKENGDDQFLKPEKTRIKRLPRLKSISRRVLGTHN